MTTIIDYDCNTNLANNILWQDVGSNLAKLITSKSDWYKEHHCDFWNKYKTFIFDLIRASEEGLVIWSKILDIQLFGNTIQSPASYPAFGFNDFGLNFNDPNSDQPNNGGNFATDVEGLFRLSTDNKRVVLQLRFASISIRPSAFSLNKILNEIFTKQLGVTVYVTDDALSSPSTPMSMTYHIQDNIDPILLRVLNDLSLNILPKPAGVSIQIESITL